MTDPGAGPTVSVAATRPVGWRRRHTTRVPARPAESLHARGHQPTNVMSPGNGWRRPRDSGRGAPVARRCPDHPHHSNGDVGSPSARRQLLELRRLAHGRASSRADVAEGVPALSEDHDPANRARPGRHRSSATARLAVSPVRRRRCSRSPAPSREDELLHGEMSGVRWMLERIAPKRISSGRSKCDADALERVDIESRRRALDPPDHMPADPGPIRQLVLGPVPALPRLPDFAAELGALLPSPPGGLDREPDSPRAAHAFELSMCGA